MSSSATANSTGFSPVLSTEIPGDFFKCNKCRVVVGRDEMEGHVCRKSEAVLEKEQIIAWVEEEYKRFTSDDLSAEEKMKALFEWDRREKVWLEHRRKALANRYPRDMVKAIAVKVMKDLVERLQKMQHDEYEKNDERRSKGMSFEERMRLFDQQKIQWCEHEIARLEKLQRDFQVWPWGEAWDWLTHGDIDLLKKLGIEWFIRNNLDRICYVGKK